MLIRVKKESILLCHDMRAQQKGMSLIEVLISIVILSLGLLGLAALQLNALKYNQDALGMTQVVQLVDELFERIRATPEKQYNKFLFPEKKACDHSDNNSESTLVKSWLRNVCQVLGDDAKVSVSRTNNDFAVQIKWQGLEEKQQGENLILNPNEQVMTMVGRF